MIIRRNGGQCIQVISQWNRIDKTTKYRARKCDTQGRSQSEFTEWMDSFDKAVETAEELPKTKRGELNNSQ